MTFAGILPKTNVRRVRAAVVITCVIFSLFAAMSFYLAFRARAPLFDAILMTSLGAMFAGFAIYLWRLRSWARKAARLCIAFSIFCFVSYRYNWQYISDYRAYHGVDPDFLIVSLISFPCIGVGLWCLRTLSKFPEEFGVHSSTPVSGGSARPL
jgi:hypothetical protein